MIEAKVKELNGKIESGGINWTWASFPTADAALAFDKWCLANHYETRGVYPPSADGTTWSVRFR